MPQLAEGPESSGPPEVRPETLFVQKLANIILEEELLPYPLGAAEPGQPIIVDPEAMPSFMNYMRARVARIKQVETLAQSLPEDIRDGGRTLLDILPALMEQAVNVENGDFEHADPIPCPHGTKLPNFAAALLIISRHADMTITGTYAGLPVIASPQMNALEVYDGYFENFRPE